MCDIVDNSWSVPCERFQNSYNSRPDPQDDHIDDRVKEFAAELVKLFEKAGANGHVTAQQVIDLAKSYGITLKEPITKKP